MFRRPKGITTNVIILGFVSLLTDMSSDMVYPLLPLFLTVHLGASVVFVGLIEGFAESTAAFFMLIAGTMADRMKDRSRLVLAGYGLSSISKPLIALAQSPLMVLFVRFADRMGKGVRGSPRDALIADSTESHHRGKAYGLHRSMDHAGAVIGPLIATLLLATFVKDLRVLFWIATIPGVLAVALIIWKVREVAPDRQTMAAQPFRFRLPKGKLRIFLGIYLLFILSASSDAFILLKAGELGVPQKHLPMLWLIFNLCKALLTYPLGALSDQLGRRRSILFGWIIYSLVYLGFGFASQLWQIWVLFFGYGLFYAFTEGGERALISDYADPAERGQAFGWYYFIIGLGSLPASFLFGAIWYAGGSQLAFCVSAVISLAAALGLFLFLQKYPSTRRSH